MAHKSLFLYQQKKKGDFLVKQYIPQSALEILMNSPLFEGFSESELKSLFLALQPVFRQYAKDNIVIDEGDPADQIGFVAKGRIVAKRMTSAGRTHILAVHEPGNNFGFDAAFSSFKTSPLTFIAETDSIALFISTQCFFDRASDISVRIMSNANRILADKCIRLLYKTDVLSKLAMRDRILAYFSILATKSQSELLTPKLSREEFAQYLCVNRSALSRELSNMQKEGLVEIKRNGQVQIKCDISRLIHKETYGKCSQPSSEYK